MIFQVILFLASAVSAAVAGVTGFGIGSILTPLLAVQVGTKLAVAAISIPHLIATTMRFWRLREHVDKHVLLGFGVMSAVGGLVGALLHNRFGGPILTTVFGCLLMFGGFTGSTGLSDKLRFGRVGAWVAGGLSGMFGGLVGNQGGIRAAALLTFGISREAFVATSTAIGIVVDGARMPVYLVRQLDELIAVWRVIAISILGVVLGTLFGIGLLKRIPEKVFRRVVSFLILVLGVYMAYEGISGRV